MSKANAPAQGATRLATFDNRWFDPGRSLPTRLLWLLLNRTFLLSALPWPSALKVGLLRLFGARIGSGVVIKTNVNVKYPWNLSIGDDTWVGEGAWLDSLVRVTLGANVCLSQGCMIETGNHDWSKPTFDLIVKPVTVEDGAWVAVKALMLPGSRLASHAILGAGSVLSGDTEPYGVYVGVPARKVKDRIINPAG